MMGVRFGWLGATRRASLRALLAGEVAQWSRDWWIDHASAEVDVHHVDDSDEGQESSVTNAMIWSSDSGSLGFAVDEHALDSLGLHLAAATEIDSGKLAQELGHEALSDLATRLWRRAGMPIPSLTTGAGETRWIKDRFGAYSATLALGRLEWRIGIDRRIADRLVPPAVSKTAALSSRPAALANTRLSVAALLDFGSISLSSLSDLRVGEVLVGDCGLDQPIQLGLAGHPRLATGQLRRADTQYAVVLDGLSKQDEYVS